MMFTAPRITKPKNDLLLQFILLQVMPNISLCNPHAHDSIDLLQTLIRKDLCETRPFISCGLIGHHLNDLQGCIQVWIIHESLLKLAMSEFDLPQETL
jgi:hypothetical protein